MNFQKYHGAGNDFIITTEQNLTNQKIASLCQNHYSIGADGLIIIKQDSEIYQMKYFNKDGSSATMCGNGLRCAAKYIYDNSPVKATKIKIQTDVQIHQCEIIDEDTVRVEMGMVDFNSSNISCPKLESFEYKNTLFWPNYYFMTTDHVVIDIIGAKFKNGNLELIGEKMMNNKCLIKGTNTNFIIKQENDEITIITFERGVGITNACGSGACAAAWHVLEGNNGKLKVNQMGGSVLIEIKDSIIYLTGPAKYVFKGEI
jgi:diaminopimelate epimerase